MSHETSTEHASAHHDFDGEPATELPADEPRTPGWVPALGLALFVVVGGVLLVRGSGPSEAPPAPAPAAPQTAAQAAPPAPVQPAPPTQGAPTAAARPPGTRTALTPEAARDLQKRIDEARKRRAEGGAATAPAAPPPPAR